MKERRTIFAGHDEWPERLAQVHPVPTQLHVRGRPLQDVENCVAVVGTRRPTAAGVEAARSLTKGLVEAGFVIVSGLAMGIDSIAHETALKNGGITVAVLGCGLDQVYPKRNRSLKERIEKHGTVVSEYPHETESAAWRFPERNRIIAGLSAGVLIVEGSFRSGALITAREGLDAEREVFAVPGSIRNPMAAAPNELIRTDQAGLVTDVKHITDVLAPQLIYPRPVDEVVGPVALDEGEKTLLFLLDDTPVSTDLACRETGMSVGEAAISLSRLEVRNFVRRRRAGYELTEAGARVRHSLVPTE